MVFQVVQGPRLVAARRVGRRQPGWRHGVAGVPLVQRLLSRLNDVAGCDEIRLPGAEADHVDAGGLKGFRPAGDRHGRRFLEPQYTIR